MTPQLRFAGWWRLLLAALAAAVVTLLGAGTAAATTLPNVETRVGASTLATVVVVGPHECIAAGQQWGHAPPQAPMVVATGVAANRGLVGGITRLSPDEVATGTRLAQLHPERFSESQHVGAEFVDDLGRSYDALGTPAASKYWNESQFLRAIDTHLLKSNNFTVIDLTGFGSSQVSTVRTYVSGLSSAQQSAIIRIGF